MSGRAGPVINMTGIAKRSIEKKSMSNVIVRSTNKDLNGM